MSSISTTAMEQPTSTSRPHSSSLSSLNTLKDVPSTTSSHPSISGSPSISPSEMHSKLTKQMQARTEKQQRWQSWQAQQLHNYESAALEAEQNTKSKKGFTAKRPHVHLDKIGRGLKKLRG